MADVNVKDIVKQIQRGELKDMSALVPCFHVGNRTMSLEDRAPFKPLFTLHKPRYTTVMCGRQVSKSFSMCMTSILMAGMVDNLSLALIEPRFEQKKRMNAQVLSPLLKGFELYSQIMDPKGAESLEIKTFRNSNTLLLASMYLSADGVRGASGLGACMYDECLQRECKLLVYDFELGKLKNKKVSEISYGDSLISFKDGAIVYSMAVKDASYRGKRSCYKVTTKSSRTITCTEGHLLPTNIGKKRLGEIVDYVYDQNYKRITLSASAGRGLYTGTAECIDGVIDGGRCSKEERKNDQGFHVESRLESTRVQFTQIPAITRARNARTIQERESGLRRILVSIDSEVFQNISLVVCANTSEWCDTKNHNERVFGYDRSSNCTSLVVHGRRYTAGTEELWQHFDQWIYRRRSTANFIMVEGLLGGSNNTIQNTTHQYRQRSNYSATSEEGLSIFDGTYKFLYTFLHGVQNQGSDHPMCLLWKHDAEICTALLLPGMCGSLSENCKKYILSEQQRTPQREITTVESSASNENQRASTGSLPQSTTRTEGEVSRVSEGLCRKEQGQNKCPEARLEATHEGGSYIRGQVEGGEEALLRSIDGRSCEKGAQECCFEGTQSRAFCSESGKGERSTKSLSGQVERGSGETEEAIGERPFSCEEEKRTYDSGTNRDESSEKQGTVQQAYAENQSRSCIIRGIQEKTSREICQETGGQEKTSAELIVGSTVDYFYDPIISIEYVGEDDVYDVEVVGTHNYMLSNGICSYNCADLNPEFIPIVDSTMAAHETFGFSIFLGSAKTEDDALGDNFQNSSQGHWCVPCSCGHFNIAAPDQDLLKMIGKEGLICSKCGKRLYTKTGYYVHAYPSRRTYHAGYHVPQIVLPFHCERPHKWADILYEQQRWGKTEFYNEVLGIPVDSSTRLLSLKELLAARNYCNNTLEQAVSLAKNYHIIVVGVDWSGGGGGKSRTAIAVIGRQYGSIKTDCIYLKALRQGGTLDEEANEVAKVADAVQADYIAHDYTGAGFQREYILYSQYPYLKDLNYPVSLAHKPTSQLISYSNNGSRSTYVADRTRALLLLFSAVKSRNFTVPMFDPKDDMAPQLELLNEIEKPQTLESNSNVYLLQKVASKYDDCCFACAIGNLCMCDVTQAYPEFSMDTRYEMSPQQIEAVYGPDSEWKNIL